MTISAEQLKEMLELAFDSAIVHVVDDSEAHRGHSGWREGGGTHFRVRIVSPDFEGVSRLERHRRVHEVLSSEFQSSLHALAIRALTPLEDNPSREGGESTGT